MRVIEKKVGESVSPEMLQQAKNLRNLATLVEGGTAVAVAYAWVEKDEDGYNCHSTFCGDTARYTLAGVVSVLSTRLSVVIGENDG